ncbi:SdpI family protein [Agreia pratensis]|uniref:SdpI/YhfL protein family protein n=1 Tax=Agreia pratensis TaxID=150121 RepID=A0A1X7I2P6_9MICO|nr:SdpI family protein [Agreia pratensis]MBF4633547.1 SdpI family protein [Agreia pratensis]SMG08700.1 SdpI/YhfL protein family protein [Agreia pratensis]
MQTQDPVAALILLGWLSAGLLLMIAVICLAAKRGSLTVNPMVGLRLPSLMRDEESWRVGHAAALMPALIALVLAVAFDLIGLVALPAYGVAIAAFVVGLVVCVIRASKATSRSSGL